MQLNSIPLQSTYFDIELNIENNHNLSIEEQDFTISDLDPCYKTFILKRKTLHKIAFTTLTLLAVIVAMDYVFLFVCGKKINFGFGKNLQSSSLA